MTWRILPARSAFAGFAGEWDRLNCQLSSGHPFFDSRFIGPQLEFFGDGSELLCVHQSSAEIDGALLLRPLGLGRWALFLPAQTQAGAVLLADGRLLETLMPQLPGYAWSLDLLSLDPAYGTAWTGLRLPRTVAPHTLTMAVALDGGFDSYWQARPRNLVKNMRRYRRRAEEQSGPLVASTITDPAQIRDALTRYGTLEAAGWKGDAGTAITIDNIQGRFYEKALRSFAATGQAMVMELRVGGKLVASRLFILDRHMWIILKTTYDESMAALAPGRQLLYEVLKQAFLELPSGSVEFYTNATRDQSEWATSLRYIQHHQLFRNDPLAATYALASTLRRSLKRIVERGAPDKSSRFAPYSVATYQTNADFPSNVMGLLDGYATRNVEFSADWFANLQQTRFGGDEGVRYYVMDFDGRPSALLPLRLARSGPVRKILSLSNYYTSLYSPILAAGSTAFDLVPLLEAANQHQGNAHVMRFAPMDPASRDYETLLTALRSCGWIPFRFFCFGNWYLTVTESWAEYLRKREGKLRSTLRRMGKKFAAEGGTLEIVTDPTLAEPAIRAFNDVYALSWKKPEPYPEFVPGLIQCLAARGELRLGIARLAGRPVAAQLWIVSHGRASIFKLAHDGAFAGLSPGTLLTAHLMEHVIDRDRVSEVDYLIGDDPYKRAWMSDRRERWGIVAYNPRTLIGLALAVREVAGRLLRRLVNLRHPARHSGGSMPDRTQARG